MTRGTGPRERCGTRRRSRAGQQRQGPQRPTGPSACGKTFANWDLTFDVTYTHTHAPTTSEPLHQLGGGVELSLGQNVAYTDPNNPELWRSRPTTSIPYSLKINAGYSSTRFFGDNRHARCACSPSTSRRACHTPTPTSSSYGSNGLQHQQRQPDRHLVQSGTGLSPVAATSCSTSRRRTRRATSRRRAIRDRVLCLQRRGLLRLDRTPRPSARC